MTQNQLITGETGSGKSTSCIKHILEEEDHQCVFYVSTRTKDLAQKTKVFQRSRTPERDMV